MDCIERGGREMEEKILEELKKANESLRRIADSSGREKRGEDIEDKRRWAEFEED